MGKFFVRNQAAAEWLHHNGGLPVPHTKQVLLRREGREDVLFDTQEGFIVENSFSRRQLQGRGWVISSPEDRILS
jgi:hypothetical protein